MVYSGIDPKDGDDDDHQNDNDKISLIFSIQLCVFCGPIGPQGETDSSRRRDGWF